MIFKPLFLSVLVLAAASAQDAASMPCQLVQDLSNAANGLPPARWYSWGSEAQAIADIHRITDALMRHPLVCHSSAATPDTLLDLLARITDIEAQLAALGNHSAPLPQATDPSPELVARIDDLEGEVADQDLRMDSLQLAVGDTDLRVADLEERLGAFVNATAVPAPECGTATELQQLRCVIDDLGHAVETEFARIDGIIAGL
jgi:uncharacterized coiled-coil protein SlyX